MGIECHGWNYTLAFIVAPNAALTKGLPYGQVPLRPDIFTWLEKRKTRAIH